MNRLEQYDYPLPPELVAQAPLADREASRLLVVDAGADAIVHDRFRRLADHLRPGDLLVLNDTRVTPARIPLLRVSGGRVDGMLLGSADGNGLLHALLRPNRRLTPGEELRVGDGEALGIRLERPVDGGGWLVRSVGGSAEDLLRRSGRAPLPPYIRRDKVCDARDEEDLARYQTVYARDPGAVAAPTAGLHFTHEMLEGLAARDIHHAFVTLHVGAGTFLPVRADDISKHRMLAERFRVPASVGERLRETRRRGGRVVAVGTTTCRALEAASASDGGGDRTGETDLFIRPGYRFREVDLLLTNFHLPRSTLLMLVAAFAGLDRVHRAYREAIERGYRFLSFGDAMLLSRADTGDGGRVS